MDDFDMDEWLEKLKQAKNPEEMQQVMDLLPPVPETLSIYELTFGMTLEEMVEQYPHRKELLVRLIEILSISNGSFTEQERAIYERLTSEIQAEKT